MSELTRETFPTPEMLRPLVPVELPMLGTIYLRRLSAAQVIDLAGVADSKQFMADLLAQSACFADGALVWANGTREQVLEYPMDVLQPLSQRAREINGLTATAVEDAKGNSDGVPDASSSSGSPSESAG